MKPMYYIGLDVHKQKICYCVKDSGGKVYAEGSANRTSTQQSIPLFHYPLLSGLRDLTNFVTLT
jgi:hypothetical protein